MDYVMRLRVFALVSIVLASFVLLVPGAVQRVFPFSPDVMTLLCYFLVFSSMMILLCSVVFPDRLLMEDIPWTNAHERLEIGTVTCLECLGCGQVLKRVWLRGDYIGKVADRCLICGDEFHVKSIYALEPRHASRRHL